jgi:Bacterial protein of unknown function (DUF899)
LNQRDVTFLCASRAPLEKLQAYKRRMGWSFPWVSAAGSEFNFDFGVSFTEEQQREGAEYNYRSLELKSVLEEGVANDQIVELAYAVGTDLAGYLTELPGLSAFALEDGRLSHLLVLCARRRVRIGLLPVPRPRAEGARRGLAAGELDPQARRVRRCLSTRPARARSGWRPGSGCWSGGSIREFTPHEIEIRS